MKFITILVAFVLLVITGACATTSRDLARISAPNSLLLDKAAVCAKFASAKAQETCLTGVLAERDRTIATAQAAAEAAKPVYQPYTGGGVYYGTNGPVATYNFTTSQCTTTLATVGGRGCR